MQSFIVVRTQTVHYGGSVSRRARLQSGIAQGSVLGPILHVLYTADVQKLVESFGFRTHISADDTQFHDSCKSTDAARLAARAMRVCYFHLRRLRTVHRSLTKESLLTFVHAFITSRVDHCNGILYGYFLDWLQSVLNSAARLILGAPKFDSISAAIRNELHWLPIGKRIRFKIALLMRHCIVGVAPEYLTELCRPVSSSSRRQSLRSASRGDFIVPRFRIRSSGYRALLSLGPMCGTLFWMKFDSSSSSNNIEYL